jgi:1-acyl-sn-glycerol-3-phosphate acyltransferase
MAFLFLMMRVILLIFALAITFVEYLLQLPRGPIGRTQWQSSGSKRVLRVLGVRVHAAGNFPDHGVLVSNHLSYIDILVYNSVHPCVFVSKSEVRGWPVFGWLARMANTIFVDRARTRSTAAANTQMEQHLYRELAGEAVPLVFFPEGTTTDSTYMLPFRSSLFQPVCSVDVPVYPAHLRYSLLAGNAPGTTVEQDVCYWGDMDFAPHMLRFLRLDGVQAEIVFGAEPIYSRDRKQAARLCEAAVRQLDGEVVVEPEELIAVAADRSPASA